MYLCRYAADCHINGCTSINEGSNAIVVPCHLANAAVPDGMNGMFCLELQNLAVGVVYHPAMAAWAVGLERLWATDRTAPASPTGWTFESINIFSKPCDSYATVEHLNTDFAVVC